MKQEALQVESISNGDYHLVFPKELNMIPTLIRQKFSKLSKLMLVMDSNINRIYGSNMISFFQKSQDVEVYTFVIQQGETQKNMENISSLMDSLFKHKFNRTDVLVGFGGGLITDFAGFAASIYKRGMKYVSIPTTVLAMSDAAIGSKTGVNNQYGKNMVGSFYDPELIIVCEKFLESLDDRNMSNGIAEIIKIAAMIDLDLFVLLELNDVKSLRDNPSILRQIIRRSMELKISIVSQDKFESDKRMILNYGHTIGHGIETASKEALLHGECVSIGIILENEIALHRYQTSFKFTKRVEKLLLQYNLPVEVPKFIKNEDVLFYMGNDKKNSNSHTFQIVFVEDVGKVIYKTAAVSGQEVLNVLSPSVKIGASDFSKISDNIVIQLAGSKSITNRVLILSALLDKEIQLQNVLFAEDTEVMMKSLQTLGACSIQQLDANTVKVKGNGGAFNFQDEKEIYVNNSGTSARFICSMLLLLKPNQSVVIRCCERMKERPIKDLIEALSDFLNFEYLEKEFYLPFRVTKKYEFKGGDIHINSKISSQYVTGILMAAPYALEPVRVILSQTEQITSEPFIQMTFDMMKQFGSNIYREKQNIFNISNTKYLYPKESYYIEPDAATASYDMAWAVLNQKKIIIKGFQIHSLQGDLKFTEKLVGLGYCVEYNDVGVIIRGDLPQKECTQTTFDFNDCTDTFITFGIILAALENNNNQSYKIVNIANQRVKECDRIHALSLNLKKFGIKTIEYDDGIEIFPNKKQLLEQCDSKQSIIIECFNDHRLGMAFSQLGNFIKNKNGQNSLDIILDEGDCVKKTFPSFYNHLQYSYSARCEKVHFSKSKHLKQEVEEINTVFVIGMRCCGKSILSKKVSNLLHMNNLSLDDELFNQFYSQKYKNLSEAINAEGWDTFRNNELQLLKQVIKENNLQKKYKNTIIACGGGIITIPEARELLRKQKYVIWLRRDFADIQKDFDKRQNTPDYQNTLKGDYEQRRPYYEQVSNFIFNFPGYTFFSKSIGEKEYWKRVEKSFKGYIKSIFNKQVRKGGQDEYLYAEESHFLCLQFEDLQRLTFADLVYIQKNFHALEVRADQFFENNFDNLSFNNNYALLEHFTLVLSRLALICNKLILIFTMRTQEEGGLLQKTKNNYYQIINYIQRQNIFNYIDIEVDMIKRENSINMKLIQQQNALILSKHFINHQDQQENIQTTIQQMKENMREQDILKLVLCSFTNYEELETIRRQLTSINPKSIIIQLGKSGKLSRVQNKYLTPVYDAKFGPPTGQGQLQKSEILQLIQELNLSSHEKKFYLFGTDIMNSPSPFIHNTCFQSLSLTTYQYELAQISSIEDFQQYINRQDFQGASITMPFKLEVSKYVDHVIGDAQLIGIDSPVINTIVKLNSKIYGFNTDWYGILKPLKKQLSLNEHYMQSKQKFALVIGAGATTLTMVYCLNMLGFQTLIYNRTYQKIEKFIGRNGVIKGFSSIDDLVLYLKQNLHVQLSVIASTVPGKAEIDFRDIMFKYKPTIFEASYIPKETSLVQYAKNSGCYTFVYGLDMLLYQAYLQNLIFTGKKVFRKQIQDSTQNYYKKLHCTQD
ncbi:pentafunctional AROM protein (macronuclear) [Tetrahymena thermophila SB210]|uniref:Pentafunctional AROM polypeptide n=2 Tax=Tetrahymena thermophila TaxID=5911 RepID=I7MKQ2_TETTS|nr:pentafunctional AROM protein [Tetrahymena thermophila SB210]AAT74841.1 AROM polypeptide [Tetrahymena thermophila]EAR99714.2 pentafunctional AROM protein [Tetrahymena thermophila SB210]|eukprot:XP_001019959.2 pentafunctional AROM protein [Tetrahymena thermophila SB210]